MEQTKKSKFKSVHFIGMAGIGMSGLAQFYRWMGFEVTGSDRAVDNPEHKELFSNLKKQGIRIFPQDGSFIANSHTDLIVYSTAIEKDNPDLKAGKKIPVWHRADALAYIRNLMKDKISIAITGSCGKTTVTAWAGEAANNLSLDPVVLNGGMINAFSKGKYSGNFRPGKGKYFIFEADESDKSLLAFYPDYSVILNIGTDHYSKEELIRVFENFLRNTQKGAVIEKNVYDAVNPDSYKHLKVIRVSFDEYGKCVAEKNVFKLCLYLKNGRTSSAVCNASMHDIEIKLPVSGKHNAENAISVFALLQLLDLDLPEEKLTAAISRFNGVHRRFEYKGCTEKGAWVYDDYAHNVEKIVSCIKSVQDMAGGKVYTVFQPHGYGPFKFMKDLLFPELEKVLRKGDKFILLPVYYAGGTSSFSPESSDVWAEYSALSKTRGKYLYYEERDEAAEFLNEEAVKGDIVLVMGARDGSLALWANKIARGGNSV